MHVLKSGRFWLCGPATFLLAIILMLGMATWFPEGSARVDNIVLPMILFPLIWASLFFYAYLESQLKRSSIAFGTLAILHIALLAIHFFRGVSV